MSRFRDVVVVTLNHRLNVLGFLDLSAYGEEYRYSANAGMADIVEALRWVQKNIEALAEIRGTLLFSGSQEAAGRSRLFCRCRQQPDCSTGL